jgi:uncharacterized membrane protein
MNRSSTSHCRIGQLSIIVAMILASHAAVVALTSGHHAGCAEGGGCADVMSSQWATVLGIPVALFAVVLYLATLLLSVAGFSEGRGQALRFCGGLIVMAAAYFTVIQAFWIGSVCVSCMSTHGFAVFGVLMIFRGRRPASSAPGFFGIRPAPPMLAAAACLSGLAAVQFFHVGGSRAQQVQVVADDGREFARNLFFTPFITLNGGVGVALDGGALPVLGAEIPEISLGTNATREPLQVVLINDWTCAHCVELHAMLHRIYHSPASDSLPPISLRLLPAYFDFKAEAAHRAMLTVHFGTGNPAAFPTLAEEIASGKISPDAGSIRARLSEIDSDTANRWETLPAILEQSVSKAFALARAQMRRNSSQLKVSTLPQLTVFDAVLAGLPSESELVEFLRAAATRQQALLDSPLAPAAPEMDVACGCAKSAESSDHDHGPSCASIVETKPPGPVDAQPSAIDGPQIKFDLVSLKTQPITMGEAAEATFQFTNIGNQALVIDAIHTGCGCVVAKDWTREVPPGERGRISFTYDSNSKQDAGLGEHVRHVWVASNSVVRTDPSYGDPLEIKVPVTGSAAHPSALSMTTSTPHGGSAKH